MRTKYPIEYELNPTKIDLGRDKMIAIRNEYKAGIGLAAFVIARFILLGRDCDWGQCIYRFDRCWDLGE
jgi:hypothetical protein